MKNVDLANIEEITDIKRLVVGGYIAKIMAVADVEEKEYLKIMYDIEEGEFKGYFEQLDKARNFWGGNLYRSYKEAALPFFKSFITAVENSNKNFKFDNDEKKLEGKLLGVVLGEEEYIGNDGTLKTRLYVAQTRSVDEIKKGNFVIPKLKETANKPVDTSAYTEDLPF